MSRSTRTAIVPNVAWIGEASFSPGQWQIRDMDGADRWAFYPDLYEGPNGETVFLLNTHDNASVGEVWSVVYGDNAAHVQAFLDAIGLGSEEILALDAVKQTI